MSVQQYDEIGEAFEGFKSLPLMRYGEVPSFLGMVGDVSGRSVLDVACGTGFYSRELKRRGACLRCRHLRRDDRRRAGDRAE